MRLEKIVRSAKVEVKRDPVICNDFVVCLLETGLPVEPALGLGVVSGLVLALSSVRWAI